MFLYEVQTAPSERENQLWRERQEKKRAQKEKEKEKKKEKETDISNPSTENQSEKLSQEK